MCRSKLYFSVSELGMGGGGGLEEKNPDLFCVSFLMDAFL